MSPSLKMRKAGDVHNPDDKVNVRLRIVATACDRFLMLDIVLAPLRCCLHRSNTTLEHNVVFHRER